MRQEIFRIPEVEDPNLRVEHTFKRPAVFERAAGIFGKKGKRNNPDWDSPLVKGVQDLQAAGKSEFTRVALRQANDSGVEVFKRFVFWSTRKAGDGSKIEEKLEK